MNWMRKWWRSRRLRVWERRLHRLRCKLHAIEQSPHARWNWVVSEWTTADQEVRYLDGEIRRAEYQVTLLRNLLREFPPMRLVGRDERKEARQ